jgi:hypothetical protein
MKAQRGSRGVDPLILNLGARWGWVVNVTSRPLYARERNPGTHCTGGCVDWPGRVRKISPLPRFDPLTVAIPTELSRPIPDDCNFCKLRVTVSHCSS